MVQEVKVLSGSYGAEYAYGPVIFEAFSKSGGKNLHGEGYMYARNSSLNSWDSYTKESYLSTVGSAVNSAAGNRWRPRTSPTSTTTTWAATWAGRLSSRTSTRITTSCSSGAAMST